jgi:hypothetical protein
LWRLSYLIICLYRVPVVLIVLMTTFLGFYLGSSRVLDWSRLPHTLIGTVRCHQSIACPIRLLFVANR